MKILTNIRKQIKVNWYIYCVCLIILLAAILRFYSFYVAWGIGGSDTPRDIIIASVALHRHELPLIGPFSSAGPFVTGPLYYWILMPAMFFLQLSLSVPFIYFILLSLGFLFIMTMIGKFLIGNKFSLILGILVAVSPEAILASYTLNNPNLVLLFTAATLLTFVLLVRYKSLIYALLLGVSVGLAINMHYQALNLLIFIPFIILIYNMSWKKRLFNLISSLIGLIITFIPIIIWDSQQGFANIRNVMDYFLIGQYRMYIPNSWKIFLLNFLPEQWSRVVGGYYILGLILLLFVGVYLIYIFIRFKSDRVALNILAFIFIILLIVNRFYHGLRQESYMLYLSPFMLLFSALALYRLYELVIKRKKLSNSTTNIIGILIVILLICLNLISIKNSFTSQQDQMKILNQNVDKLISLYPDNKFSIYDYNNYGNGKSTLLSLELYRRGLEDENGIKIGVSCDVSCPDIIKKLNIGALGLVELPFDKNLSKKIWIDDNADTEYNLLIGWSKQHNLKSSFDLGKYLQEKLYLR